MERRFSSLKHFRAGAQTRPVVPFGQRRLQAWRIGMCLLAPAAATALLIFAHEGDWLGHFTLSISLAVLTVASGTVAFWLLGEHSRLSRIEREFELILNHTALRILFKDDKNRILRLNEPAARFFGLSVAEATGKTGYELSPNYAAERHQEDRDVIASGRPKFGDVKEMDSVNGVTYWGRADKIPYKDPHTGEDRILLVATDVTEQVNAQLALRRSEERYHLAVELSSIGTWDWNLRNADTYWSPRLKEILGLDSSFGPTFADFEIRLHPDDRSRVLEAIEVHFRDRTPFLTEYRMRHEAGSYLWVRARGRAVWDDDGQPVRMAGSVEDITERIALEQRLAFIAHHDGLTGLINRTAFMDRLKEWLRQSAKGQSFALLFVDLDGFKSINDQFGHGIGDELLKEIAVRLQEATNDSDVVARLGGDEFAVLCASGLSREGLSGRASDIIDAISRPVRVNETTAAVGVSIGIAIAPKDGLDATSLMNRADLALYNAKNGGRGTFRFFSANMEARTKDRHALSLDLRAALTNGEFDIHYQPILDLQSNKVSVVEALCRWRHPDRGMISPGEFIPVAEAAGLINQIGEWVLERACIEATRWPNAIKLAVNVSAAQFQGGIIKLAVARALAVSNLAPSRLELEITESVFLEDSEEALDNMRQLHALGVRMSLDDFGTGYSSLSYLRRFPFDKIKIDASFLRDLSGGPHDSELLHTIISLASRLGIATTAEGVETQGQLDAVRAEGCTEIQGYLFARPVPAAELSQFFSTEDMPSQSAA